MSLWPVSATLLQLILSSLKRFHIYDKNDVEDYDERGKRENIPKYHVTPLKIIFAWFEYSLSYGTAFVRFSQIIFNSQTNHFASNLCVHFLSDRKRKHVDYMRNITSWAMVCFFHLIQILLAPNESHNSTPDWLPIEYWLWSCEAVNEQTLLAGIFSSQRTQIRWRTCRTFSYFHPCIIPQSMDVQTSNN